MGRAPSLISRTGAGGRPSIPAGLGDAGERGAERVPSWEIWDVSGGESSAPGSGPTLEGEWPGEGERGAWGRGERALGRPGAAAEQPAGLGDRDRLRAPSGLGLSPAAEGSGPGGGGDAETPGPRQSRRAKPKRLLGDGEPGGCGGRLPRGALAKAREASETLPKLPEGSRQRMAGWRVPGPGKAVLKTAAGSGFR